MISLQKMQKNFRIVTTRQTLCFVKASPIALNRKPHMKRQRYGRLARKPASSKLYFNTYKRQIEDVI